MWGAQHDTVERRLVQVANLEVSKAEQVGDSRRREDEPAHLSRAEGHRVARKAASSEMRAAPMVDPAAQGSDQVLSPPRAVVGLEQERRTPPSRRRRELVPGLHLGSEIVFVGLVEVDIAGDLERA